MLQEYLSVFYFLTALTLKIYEVLNFLDVCSNCKHSIVAITDVARYITTLFCFLCPTLFFFCGLSSTLAVLMANYQVQPLEK